MTLPQAVLPFSGWRHFPHSVLTGREPVPSGWIVQSWLATPLQFPWFTAAFSAGLKRHTSRHMAMCRCFGDVMRNSIVRRDQAR